MKFLKYYIVEIKNILIYYIILLIFYSPFYKIACQKGTLKIGLILLFSLAILFNSGLKNKIFREICPLLFDLLTPKKYR